MIPTPAPTPTSSHASRTSSPTWTPAPGCCVGVARIAQRGRLTLSRHTCLCRQPAQGTCMLSVAAPRHASPRWRHTAKLCHVVFCRMLRHAVHSMPRVTSSLPVASAQVRRRCRRHRYLASYCRRHRRLHPPQAEGSRSGRRRQHGRWKRRDARRSGGWGCNRRGKGLNLSTLLKLRCKIMIRALTTLPVKARAVTAFSVTHSSQSGSS